jgi:hypothetical protein
MAELAKVYGERQTLFQKGSLSGGKQSPNSTEEQGCVELSTQENRVIR